MMKESPAHSFHMSRVLAPKSWREELGEAFSAHVGNQAGQLCVGGVWLLCPLWAAEAEVQTALRKGCRRRLAQSSLVWLRFSLSLAFARRYWRIHIVSQAALMWSSAGCLLGTVGV